MATYFSEIAEAAAYGKSVDVSRYHGAVKYTIVPHQPITNFGTDGNVVYLTPIPWYGSIINLTLFPTAPNADNPPKITGYFSIRPIGPNIVKDANGLAALQYPPILGTTNDYAAAKDHQTLGEKALSNDNTHEIPISNSATYSFTSSLFRWHFIGRTNADCYSYIKTIDVGREQKEAVVFADNMQPHATDSLGMLTWVTTANGENLNGNIRAGIEYIDPAPSSIVQGRSTRG